MQEEETNISHRDSLLDSFRRSLNKPLSERFFDEDDLIEIFDYAGDLGDDYLRMEALMCAARFYPDSEEMKQRRAIFYCQYADDVSEKFLNDNTSEAGMLWDILRIRKDNPVGEDAVKSLDFLLESYNNLSDEEIIQFVDLASYLGQYDWLKSHMPDLRAKVSYLVMLLYEVTIAADNNRDNEYATLLLEELTGIDPFNANYWLMLAKVYYSAEKYDKATSAIDYALAIDDSDYNSRLVKANLLYATEQPMDRVVAYTEEIVNENPDIIDGVRFLATLYNESKQPAKAVKLLSDYVHRNPREAAYIVPELISYRPANTDRLLDIFYANSDDNSQIVWASWAHNLSVSGFVDIARKVAECYERNSGIKLVMMFSIEDRYNVGDSEGTIEAIQQYIEDLHNNEANLPSFVLMHVVSLARLKRFPEALRLISTIKTFAHATSWRSVSSKLEFLGMLKILEQVEERIANHPDADDWHNYDPLE